jgi:peptide subunit release factor 1 (eRF1)
MLDDLLGRTELKERIAELEDELEQVEGQLSSAKRQRKEAVTEKQETQRRANKLDDRIEQLEDQVDRLQSEETSLTVRREETLSPRRLDETLSRLTSFRTGPQGALSAYIEDGHDLPREIREAFGERTALVSRAAPCLALADDAGLVSVCLRPAVTPDPFAEWSDSFRLDEEWFLPRGRYTLALVRSDLFAMGTYEGDQRTAFHGFDSQLKSQHSKGGFSQSRFERLRDEQIDDHLDRCQTAIEQREADRLFVVGERSVLTAFMGVADETTSVDATGDPEDALRDAWEDFWATQMRIV